MFGWDRFGLVPSGRLVLRTGWFYFEYHFLVSKFRVLLLLDIFSLRFDDQSKRYPILLDLDLFLELVLTNDSFR